MDKSERVYATFDSDETPCVTSLRKEASGAAERVVALVYFRAAEFSFKEDPARISAGQAQIVACSSEYRHGNASSNSAYSR
jgi:hypothetical protein